jgi:hypothetical protein
MSKRWFDPATGVERVQDDAPNPGWLAVITIQMPDGRQIDSTLQSLESWLATSPAGYVVDYDSNFDEIRISFGDAASAAAFGDQIVPTITSCRYFVAELDDDNWYVGIDGSVPTYDGDEVIGVDDEADPDVPDISGGGGGGGPGPGPPPIPPVPWEDKVPFPETGPEPGPPEIPINDEQPDDSTPIDQLAKEQADEDLKGIIPDPDGDFEHPDGAPANEKKDRKPCSDCDGTGQKPEDDGAGGDDGDESDGGDGDEEDGDGDGDGEGDESGEGEGDQDEESEGGGDGEGEGEGSSPGECETCGGSGEMPDPAGEDGDGDGDEGDESGDGDDDAEEEDQPQPDDPYDPGPVVEAANRAINAANRAIQSDDPEEIRQAVSECFQAIQDCSQAVDKRSTTQRQVLQRALDAGQRALEASQ